MTCTGVMSSDAMCSKVENLPLWTKNYAHSYMMYWWLCLQQYCNTNTCNMNLLVPFNLFLCSCVLILGIIGICR